jgi:CoA:oxalate CoA-transferase
MKPLEGILVLEFCQYLAGPSATLRLADLGARVIKIERPGTGDGSRHLVLEGCVYDGDGVNFHNINRNKESVALNTKDPHDLELVRRLVSRADVLVESFRPGVMERMGLGYEEVRSINPRIVYASITGYGKASPWARKPGQDLLVQSLSGLAWLNGNDDQPPMPFALSLADSYAGVHAAEGILSCLVRREATGVGGRVEVSLLASILDLQFEVVTTYLNDGHKPPHRSAFNNAHAYLAAPYGIYRTSDGFIALAMGSVPKLGEALGSPAVASHVDQESWFTERDQIKLEIQRALEGETTKHWLDVLEGAGFWCSDVLSWRQLMQSDAFKALDFIQDISRDGCGRLLTTRCPITFAGEGRWDSAPAPRLGADTRRVIEEFCGEEHAAARTACAIGQDATKLPLAGVTVLDFGQFLSAPSGTLRLADLGARVIKVEKPGTGDICRRLYISNCVIDGDSSLFHAINRNKESIELDLKDPDSRPLLEKLLRLADVVVVNYRPGVADRLGIGYESVRSVNPDVVYAEITGYGPKGPWRDKPGQDLLAQALSGICWVNGNRDQPPTPMGLSVGDLFAGQHMVQGILAGLLRVRRGGGGAHVRVSLLESLLDIQFEDLTTYLNDGERDPVRSSVNNASPFIDAPYGIYRTKDGYIAIAMIPVPRLGELIDSERLMRYTNPDDGHAKRDEIKAVVAEELAKRTTAEWLSVLEPADVWCSDVLTWDELMATEAFESLDMVQTVRRKDGTELETTSCPILIDGRRAHSPVAAPKEGEDTERIVEELTD